MADDSSYEDIDNDETQEDESSSISDIAANPIYEDYVPTYDNTIYGDVEYEENYSSLASQEPLIIEDPDDEDFEPIVIDSDYQTEEEEIDDPNDGELSNTPDEDLTVGEVSYADEQFETVTSGLIGATEDEFDTSETPVEPDPVYEDLYLVTISNEYALENYDPVYLQELSEAGASFFALYDDGEEEEVEWTDIVDPSPENTIISMDDLIANATNQHFWDDDTGAHVAEISKEDWNSAVESNFSDLSSSKNYYNILLNSLGVLLRRALLNLVSINRTAISFYDGLGNETTNIMSYFGRNSSQIGPSDKKHIVLNNDGITAYNGDGTVAPLQASNIQAAEAAITNLSATKADISDLNAATARIGTLESTSATITQLNAEKARIDTLSTTKANVSDLNAATARIGSLEADHVSVDDLEAVNASIESLEASKADISDLTAATARIGSLEADHVSVDDLEAVNASIESLEADKADISDLNAATARIGTLESTSATITQLNTEKARIDTLSTTKADVADLTAATARIGSLEADHVSVDDLDAVTADIESLEASKADISVLEADYITAQAIAAQYAQINLANVSNAWIQSGTIKDGAISSAMINTLSANKIVGGTADFSKIEVTNLKADDIQVERINGQTVSNKTLVDALSQHETDISDLSDELDSAKENLQRQIDGAIETWTGTDIPTLQNTPASSWNTNAIKDTHVGDVYFVVNSQSQQNGYNYRFTKTGEGSSATYSWQLIKDNDVTNALQRLTDAEGRIGTIETFDTTVSSFMTDTDAELTSIKSAATTLAGRVDTAEGTLATKVDTATFNTLSQTVDGNSSSIQQLTTETTTLTEKVTLGAPYTQVEWVESDGHQFIATRYQATQDSGFDIDVALIDGVGINLSNSRGKIDQGFVNVDGTTYTGTMFGTFYKGSLRIFGLSLNGASGRSGWVCCNATNALNANGSIGFYADGRRQQASLRNRVYTAPDGTVKTLASSSDFITDYYVYVFSGHETGTATIAPIAMRLYSLKFYDGDEIAMDLIPAIRNSDDVPGLYDSIEKHFYPCQTLEHGPKTDTLLGEPLTLLETIAQESPIVLDTRTNNSRIMTGDCPVLTDLRDGQRLIFTSRYTYITETAPDYPGTTGSSANCLLDLTLANGKHVPWGYVYYNAATIMTSQYGAGSTLNLVYRENVLVGTNAIRCGFFCDSDYNTNTNDTARYVQWYNSIFAKKAIRNASIIVGDEDGYEEIGENVTFDLSYPILWRTAALAINKTDYQYSWTLTYDRTLATCYPDISGVKNQMLYLVGEPSGGMFTIKSPILTFDIPTEADGLYYIPIGKLGNQSTGKNYLVFSTAPNPTMFAYIGDAFQQVQSLVVKTTNKLNETVDTVDEHTRKIGSLETTVETKANGSTVEIISNNLSALQQDVNGFKTTVSETYSTKEEMALIPINGRNLLKNSLTIKMSGSDVNGRTDSNTPMYRWAYSNKGEVHSYAFTAVEGATRANNNAYTSVNYIPGIAEMRGKHYSWALDVKIDGLENLGDTVPLSFDIDVRPSSTTGPHVVSLYPTDFEDGVWKHIGASGIVGPSDSSSLFEFGIGSMDLITGPFTISYRRPIVVYGTIPPTEWTAAPEDNANSEELINLSSRVSMAESTIEQHSTSIALKANSADVYTKTQSDGLISTEVTNRNAAISAATDAINLSVSQTYATQTALSSGVDTAKAYTDSEISSAKAAIKITTDGISSEVSNKVGASEIISKINQSSETIKIQASKVEIDGTAIFTAISSDVDGAITDKGYATTTQAQGYANTAKSEAISAAATDATSKANAAEANAKAAIPSDISELNNDTGFITNADVPTKVSDLTNDSGFQTASQVNTTITGKGYQTASQVDSAITSKGYQTSTQVESAITSKGYATTTQAQGYANTAEQNAINAIPTDISDLNNDAGFITSADVPTKVSDLTNDSNFATTSQAQGYANTAESNAKTYAETQAGTVNSALETYKTSTNATLTSLQNQVDGQIEAWYKSVDPTASNEPASTWTTDILKARHEGDLYYNVTNGHSWRWMLSGNTYSWQQIPDSDASAALAVAQNAQTLAGSKRRIFTATPVPPYDSGDLWVDGASIRYASQSKADNELYSESDWSVTATDDSAANSLRQELEAKIGESPYPYQEVEWIESDGKQFIYLDWKPVAETFGFEVDFLIRNAFSTSAGAWNATTNINGFGNVFGVRNSSLANDFQLGSYNAYGIVRLGNKDIYAYITRNTRQTCSLIGNVYTDPTGTAKTITRGTTVANKPYHNMTIFAMYEGATRKATVGGLAQPGSVRIYSLKFYEDTTIAVNLTPAVRLSDNVAGLWDSVSNHFYPARGASVGEKIANSYFGEVHSIAKTIETTNPSLITTNTAASRLWTADAPTLDSLVDGQQITITPIYNSVATTRPEELSEWDESTTSAVGNVYIKLTLANNKITEWIPVYYSANARLTTHYVSGAPITLTYHENMLVNVADTGGSAVVRGWFQQPDYNTNTTYNLGQNIHGTAITAKEAITKYHLIMGDALGYQNVVAGDTFDISYPLLLAYAAAIAATKTSSGTYETYPAADFSYSGTIEAGAANKMLYLKGTASGNTFTVAASPFMTTVVPDETDGYLYIPLGIMSSNKAANFVSSKDLYAYLDGEFRQVTPTEIVSTHRVYYRTATANSSLAAPTTWIEEATANVYNQWTTKVPPLAASTAAGQTKYLYLYTCEQRKRLDGTIVCTKVLLDENTTVIDGGSIITNSITANQIDASELRIGYSNVDNPPSIPSKTSDLTNDSNYATTTQAQGYADAKDSAINAAARRTDVSIAVTAIDYAADTATLSATLYIDGVATTSNVSYQWLRDGTSLTGSTSRTLSVTSSMGIGHVYSCTCTYS